MTEDIVGRVAGSAADAMDLMDKVNRSGLGKAIPQLAQMVENGDLQRLVNLPASIMLAGCADRGNGRAHREAAAGGLSLLDQVNRSGLEKALPVIPDWLSMATWSAWRSSRASTVRRRMR